LCIGFNRRYATPNFGFAPTGRQRPAYLQPPRCGENDVRSAGGAGRIEKIVIASSVHRAIVTTRFRLPSTAALRRKRCSLGGRRWTN